MTNIEIPISIKVTLAIIKLPFSLMIKLFKSKFKFIILHKNTFIDYFPQSSIEYIRKKFGIGPFKFMIKMDIAGAIYNKKDKNQNIDEVRIRIRPKEKWYHLKKMEFVDIEHFNVGLLKENECYKFSRTFFLPHNLILFLYKDKYPFEGNDLQIEHFINEKTPTEFEIEFVFVNENKIIDKYNINFPVQNLKRANHIYLSRLI